MLFKFSQAFKKNCLSHAYLFTGGSPELRVEAAFEAASLLNCENPGVESACRQCSQCLKTEEKNHPDLYFIDTENSSIKITEVRDLKKNLGFKKYLGRYRVVIINEAEKMTDEAGNCVLKVLEEPLAYTVFILLSSSKGLLLPTIISRCQEIYLGHEEHYGPIEDFESRITELFKGNKLQVIELAARIEKDKSENIFLQNLLKWLRDCIVWQKTLSKELLFNSQWINSLEECKIDVEKCSYLAEKIIETSKTLETNANKALIIENLLLEIALLD